MADETFFAAMAALAADAQDMRFVECEIAGKPVRVHYRPVLTAGDAVQIQAAMEKGGQGEAVLRSFLILSRDADGRKLFGAHKEKWVRDSVPWWVVERVVAQMDLVQPDAETLGKP